MVTKIKVIFFENQQDDCLHQNFFMSRNYENDFKATFNYHVTLLAFLSLRNGKINIISKKFQEAASKLLGKCGKGFRSNFFRFKIYSR